VSAGGAAEGGHASVDGAADSCTATADGRVMTNEDARILATIHHLYRHLRRLPGTDGTTRQKHPAYAVIEARIRALGQRLTPNVRPDNEDPASPRSPSGQAVRECAPIDVASNSTPSLTIVRRGSGGGGGSSGEASRC